MTAQLLLSALFVATGGFALAVIAASIAQALPRLRALRAEMAAGDPMREVTWRVTTVEVRRLPAPVSVLPVRRKAALVPQSWRAAA
ncbi:hypothetical protein [Novosphingobium sp. TH158]|uniref:hypothetical protein n=1 Tax=Novosphingobium sp. TH158 TaxID=2067455 RepID=UPI000C7DAD66|nr:hypothetical protein [Novosphingobium sp. TH158]PLK25676.1 hypothetical protein C0V78_01300 [Novosphingobium sp. TH158]